MTIKDKDPAILAFMDSLARSLGGPGLSVLPTDCPTCGGRVDEFRDDLSRREHAISGMCQSCQDKVFEGEEP